MSLGFAAARKAAKMLRSRIRLVLVLTDIVTPLSNKFGSMVAILEGESVRKPRKSCGVPEKQKKSSTIHGRLFLTSKRIILGRSSRFLERLKLLG